MKNLTSKWMTHNVITRLSLKSLSLSQQLKMIRLLRISNLMSQNKKFWWNSQIAKKMRIAGIFFSIETLIMSQIRVIKISTMSQRSFSTIRLLNHLWNLPYLWKQQLISKVWINKTIWALLVVGNFQMRHFLR